MKNMKVVLILVGVAVLSTAAVIAFFPDGKPSHDKGGHYSHKYQK